MITNLDLMKIDYSNLNATIASVKMNASRIDEMLKGLKQADATRAEKLRAIDIDTRISDLVKRERRTQVEEQTRQEKTRIMSTIWGHYDATTGLWSGGDLPAELARADAAVKIARAKVEEGDPLDAGKLSNAIAGARALVNRFDTLPALANYYQTAGRYERRALQVMAGELLPERFPKDLKVRSTVKHWAADMDADFQSAELDKALEVRAELQFVLNRAAGITQRMTDQGPFTSPSNFSTRVEEFWPMENFAIVETGESVI